MRIGYLQLGPSEHGVRRYGDMLGAEVRRTGRRDVVEVPLELSGRPLRDLAALRWAAARLSEATVVHVQYSPHQGRLWGRGVRQFLNASLFAALLRPPLVATLHDVHPGVGVGQLAAEARRGAHDLLLDALGRPTSGPARSPDVPRHLSRGVRIRRFGGYVLEAIVLDRLARRFMAAFPAAATVVFSAEERRIVGGSRAARVHVVPHFVEALDPLPSRAEARAELGFDPQRPVATVLGWIHSRKGHALAVDALPLLPQELLLVLAGADGSPEQAWARQLEQRAEALGVRERMLVTGYLDEREQRLHLAAADVPLCPFPAMAGSGSLSTWLAARRVPLVSRLPQSERYAELAPGAVRLFAPYAADALAEAVAEYLSDPPDAGAVEPLLQTLSLAAVAREHVAIYDAVARSFRGASGRGGA